MDYELLKSSMLSELDSLKDKIDYDSYIRRLELMREIRLIEEGKINYFKIGGKVWFSENSPYDKFHELFQQFLKQHGFEFEGWTGIPEKEDIDNLVFHIGI